MNSSTADIIGGVLLVILAVVNIFGELMLRGWVPSCHGEPLFMFVIVHCTNEELQVFFQLILDFSRSIIEPPISLGEQIFRLHSGNDRVVENIIIKLVTTIPLALIIWFGSRFWIRQWRYAPIFFVIPLAAVIAEYI